MPELFLIGLPMKHTEILKWCIMREREEGSNACEKGLTRADNPYNEYTQKYEREQWDFGWQDKFYSLID